MNWSFSGPPKSSRKILTFSMIKTNILYHLFLSFMLNLLSLPFAWYCYARLWTHYTRLKTWVLSLHSLRHLLATPALESEHCRCTFWVERTLYHQKSNTFNVFLKFNFSLLKGSIFRDFLKLYFSIQLWWFLRYPWHATYHFRLFFSMIQGE